MKGMLFLVVLLIVLWALGLMTSYTLGGLLHILLVVAIILFLVHIIQGRPIGRLILRQLAPRSASPVQLAGR